MDTPNAPSTAPWVALSLILGPLALGAGCSPSTSEVLGPYYSGRIEAVTTQGQDEGKRIINPKAPVVFRWQPRSHHPLTTLPEAYVVVLSEAGGTHAPLKARVEQQGPFLEVTIPPGAPWPTLEGPLRFGIAAGLGHGDTLLETLKTAPLSHKPGQGALMTCDGLIHDWSICWLDGQFVLTPSP